MAEQVMVGCKLPNGLVLFIGKESVRINGRARYLMPSMTRINKNPETVEGDGMTMVDKAFWDKWLSDHKDYAPIVSGSLYSANSQNDAKAKAKETKEVQTGLEPMDPTKPPPGMKAIEPTDETLREISKPKVVASR